MDDPFTADNQRLTPPAEFEAIVRRSLPPGAVPYRCRRLRRLQLACADGAAVHHAAGAARPDDGYEYPAWCRNALGGLPAAIDPGLFIAAKTMAATFLDLLAHPEMLERAKAEFNERTGGGVGGSEVGGAAAAARLRSAGRSALAGIHHHRARRGVVDTDAVLRFRRWRETDMTL